MLKGRRDVEYVKADVETRDVGADCGSAAIGGEKTRIITRKRLENGPRATSRNGLTALAQSLKYALTVFAKVGRGASGALLRLDFQLRGHSSAPLCRASRRPGGTRLTLSLRAFPDRRLSHKRRFASLTRIPANPGRPDASGAGS